MTKDDVIRWAREVGLPHWYETEGVVNEALLIEFAKLVAEHEREACAKTVETFGTWDMTDRFAAAIRARGQA